MYVNAFVLRCPGTMQACWRIEVSFYETLGATSKTSHPASSQPIDSRSAPAVRFYRTVIYLPHGAKYNPEQGLESSVSGCSYASNHCPNRRFCAQEFP